MTDEQGKAIMIPLRERDGYVDDNFFRCLELFYLTENLGCLPFGGGWAEQPESVVLAINCLKLEQARMEKEEYEKEKKRPTNGG